MFASNEIVVKVCRTLLLVLQVWNAILVWCAENGQSDRVSKFYHKLGDRRKQLSSQVLVQVGNVEECVPVCVADGCVERVPT